MRLRTTVYRAHHPRWAFEPTSGAGAARHGGRFNPPGMAALYTARGLTTAWLEAQQGFAFKAQPMTMCAYEVDCDDVLDLTDDRILADHAIMRADLACAWELMAARRERPLSWILARNLTSIGIAGVIVPSFATGASIADVNVVFWNWSDEPPHRVRVIDPTGRLPKNQESWR